MTHDHGHDHEVIVDNRGSSLGTIVGIVVILAFAVGLWYFALGPGKGTFGGSGTGTDINVNVELPSVAPAAS